RKRGRPEVLELQQSSARRSLVQLQSRTRVALYRANSVNARRLGIGSNVYHPTEVIVVITSTRRLDVTISPRSPRSHFHPERARQTECHRARPRRLAAPPRAASPGAPSRRAPRNGRRRTESGSAPSPGTAPCTGKSPASRTA